MNQPPEISPLAPRADQPELPERWYLPSWWERLVLMKWRVLYFVPAVLLVPLSIVAPFAVLWWWKVVVPVVALSLAAAINTAQKAVRLRKEPFCIHCGYDLTGLPDGHRCPECGFVVHSIEIDDYRRDPHWFIKRRRMGTALPESGAVIAAGPVRSKKSRDGT